jgi:hypothetical protein
MIRTEMIRAEMIRSPVPPTLSHFGFIGWLKSRETKAGHEVMGPWRAVVGGDGYDECWMKLLDVKGGRSCDRVVLNRLRRP